jgi:hypothetical protein
MGARLSVFLMDHAYIDENSLTERYLAHSLTDAERADFEAHLVDCQECTERLLLAEMFHSRNGHSTKPDAETVAKVVVYKPRKMILILVAAGLAIPAGYLFWLLVR